LEGADGGISISWTNVHNELQRGKLSLNGPLKSGFSCDKSQFTLKGLYRVLHMNITLKEILHNTECA